MHIYCYNNWSEVLFCSSGFCVLPITERPALQAGSNYIKWGVHSRPPAKFPGKAQCGRRCHARIWLHHKHSLPDNWQFARWCSRHVGPEVQPMLEWKPWQMLPPWTRPARWRRGMANLSLLMQKIPTAEAPIRFRPFKVGWEVIRVIRVIDPPKETGTF